MVQWSSANVCCCVVLCCRCVAVQLCGVLLLPAVCSRGPGGPTPSSSRRCCRATWRGSATRSTAPTRRRARCSRTRPKPYDNRYHANDATANDAKEATATDTKEATANDATANDAKDATAKDATANDAKDATAKDATANDATANDAKNANAHDSCAHDDATAEDANNIQLMILLLVDWFYWWTGSTGGLVLLVDWFCWWTGSTGGLVLLVDWFYWWTGSIGS